MALSAAPADATSRLQLRKAGGGTVPLPPGWLDMPLPEDLAVFAVSAILELAPPPGGWAPESAKVIATLEEELCSVAKVPRGVVRISEVLPDAHGHSLKVGFFVLHPSVLPSALPAAGEEHDPRAPLRIYGAIFNHVVDVWNEAQMTAANTLYRRPRRSRPGGGPPLLKALCAERLILQCSMLISECPAAQRHSRKDLQHQVIFGKALMQVHGLLCEAALWRGVEASSAQAAFAAELEALNLDVERELMKGAREAEAIRASGCAQEDGGGAFAEALQHFRPDLRQLSLRLRELAVTQEADRCSQLLTRWGGAEVDGGLGVWLAVVGRNPRHFRGQSALDLALATKHAGTVRALLAFVPEVPPPAEAPALAAAADEVAVGPPAPSAALAAVVRAVCVAAYSAAQGAQGLREVHYVRLQAALQRQAHFEALQLLNFPNPVSGQPPFYAATVNGGLQSAETLQKLVARGADASSPCRGRSPEVPVAAAARLGDSHLVSSLLALRADIDARTPEGHCILQVAAARGNAGVVAACLGHPGCQVDAIDSSGRSALIGALRGGRVDIARTLLEAACSVNVCDRNGAPPILHAAQIRDVQLCHSLLRLCADKDAVDPADGCHILHVAAKTRNEAMLRQLLLAKANTGAVHPSNGRTLLHIAAGTRWPSIVRLVLDAAAQVDAQCLVGDTPLRLAVQQNDAVSVEMLCKARADPNLPNRSGCGPMHHAVSVGNLALAELLVSFGADVNAADARRWRPIHYGVQSGSADIVGWLVDHGADPHVRSFHGIEPHHLSRIGKDDIMAILDGSIAYQSVQISDTAARILGGSTTCQSVQISDTATHSQGQASARLGGLQGSVGLPPIAGKAAPQRLPLRMAGRRGLGGSRRG